LAQRLSLLTQTHQTLSEALNQGNLIISFIPSHRWRHYFEKGYNQSELLAKHLAKELNIPVLQLAKKSKYTASQLKLSRSQRQKNLNLAFSPSHLEKIPKDSHILLVDDVTTTASTLKEVATCIKSNRPDLKIR
jgi:predicted amidophosphoribosyltransferase